MKTKENSGLFDSVIAEARKKELDPEKMAEMLLKLREALKDGGDPLVVKVLRMAAEHLQTNGTFEMADRFEDGLPDDISNLEYFIDLVAESGNKFNREELQEFKTVMGGGAL